MEEARSRDRLAELIEFHAPGATVRSTGPHDRVLDPELVEHSAEAGP